VQNAQVAYDKALADAAANSAPAVGSAKAPAGTSAATQAAATRADNDAAVQQALIALQQAQNDLQKLKEQGPTAWDVRQQELAVQAAQADLDKLRNPSAQDVQQAQAALDQAQATLEKSRNPSPYDVQQAQAAVVQAQANLQKVQSPSAADVAAAQQAMVAAQTKLDKLVSPAEGDVRTAEEDVKQAQANLDKLLVANGFDVQSAQASLDQAQANLDKALNGNTPQDIAQAQAAVDQAAAQLRQAQADLVNATLTAPFDGTVAALGVAAGEQAGASGAAVTLVDTGQLRVEAVVAETDVARVRAGQAATLTFDALPEVRADGRVEVIVPTATVQNGVVNYTVYVSLDPAQTPGLLPGMTTTAQIVTDQHTDVVLAPNRAIARQGTERSVEVVDAAGAVATRPVQVGLSNDQVSEIVGGLQPGDRVALPAAARPSTTTAALPAGGLGASGAPAFAR
jgi:multidrug resistance efflux pump